MQELMIDGKPYRPKIKKAGSSNSSTSYNIPPWRMETSHKQTSSGKPLVSPQPSANPLFNNHFSLSKIALFLAIVFPIAGIIVAKIAVNKNKDNPKEKKLATIALIIGTFLFIISILFGSPGALVSTFF